MVRTVARAVEAWTFLSAAQAALALTRFERVRAAIIATPALSPTPPSREDDAVADVLQALQLAQRFLLVRVRCLPSASACTLMLRLRGLPADVVIGVRGAPFEAHAWTELRGRVIGDDESITGTYAPVHRT